MQKFLRIIGGRAHGAWERVRRTPPERWCRWVAVATLAELCLWLSASALLPAEPPTGEMFGEIHWYE